ncbi:hypothetical protein LCGC14_0778930, partial [marine sediment metagenome]
MVAVSRNQQTASTPASHVKHTPAQGGLSTGRAKGDIPESIPVSWTPEKEQQLNYLLALGDADYNVDLALYPP